MTTIRLWQVGGTDKAYLFSKLPKDKAAGESGVWVPRSMIEHITRIPSGVNEWPECHVKMAEWFAEQKGLL